MGIFIEAEVAEALELITLLGPGFFEAWFAFGGDNFQGMGVQVRAKISVGIGFRDGEEPVVKANFSFNRMGRADPVNRSFHFSAGSCAAGFAFEISSAMQFSHV